MKGKVLDQRFTVFGIFALLTALLAPAGASAATAQEIDIKVDATLKLFQASVPGADHYLNVAKGVLVFPSVFRAGVVIGGEYGEGARRINGKTVEYESTARRKLPCHIGRIRYQLLRSIQKERKCWSGRSQQVILATTGSLHFRNTFL